MTMCNPGSWKFFVMSLTDILCIQASQSILYTQCMVLYIRTFMILDYTLSSDCSSSRWQCVIQDHESSSSWAWLTFFVYRPVSLYCTHYMIGMYWVWWSLLIVHPMTTLCYQITVAQSILCAHIHTNSHKSQIKQDTGEPCVSPENLISLSWYQHKHNFQKTIS